MIHWNGNDIPKELRELPAGTTVIEAVDTAPALTAEEDLAILTGDPENYRTYAADYFGATIPVDAVVHVLVGKKLDAQLVERITTDRTLADLRNDLAEIAYRAFTL
ncbi:MAG: hypothetical protein H0T89_26325 [Deltaproteobacteria bacterium]|nr:hypothetical protein [Deltaproteobacteria bacterium]